LAQSRVAIIGTGLIGASIGLGLSAQKDRKFEIVGVDRDRAHANEAKKLGAVDRTVGSLEEAVTGTGLIIIAVPVSGVRHTLKEIGPLLMSGAIVTDTASTKAQVMEWAKEFLPPTVSFIGGHPMAGREKSGPGAASADLFKDANWAITPAPYSSEPAVSVILGLIEALGANPIYIDPAEHDQYAAAVSHVPILLSVALFRMLRDSAGWEDASLLAGPAFRDLTRLASGDPTMSADIMATNREAVRHWIVRYQQSLDAIVRALDEGDDVVHALFQATQFDRDSFLANPPFRRAPESTADAGSSSDAIGRLLMGGGYDKMKEMLNRPPSVQADDSKLRRRLGAPDDEP
jgi:prephenate dehydrogenase